MPEPGTKNPDAMTTAELQEAAYRWVLEYNQNNKHLPTQQEVGDQFGKSRGWGRDRMKEMRLQGWIADDGAGETVDTVGELTADLERAEQARGLAVEAQRAAEANAARIEQWANQTIADARAEADRRVAAVEGATAERLKGAQRQSTAQVEQVQADYERQISEIRAAADAQVLQARSEAAAAKAEATRQLAGLEGASAERERLSEEQAAVELAQLKAAHEGQVQELKEQAEAQLQQARAELERVQVDADQRVAAAIESAPSIRRAAENQEAAEVLASTVTEKHHETLRNLMYGFYIVAAAGALTGQVWAGVEHIPFPDNWPVWGMAAVVAPAFAVLEFGGVVTAYAADLRRRLGERATGFRIMSFAAATVAAGFNLVGHWGDWTPAIGFTGLSVFAYLLWLLYSEARRRDVLRNAGMMSRPAPVYGLMQWLREPKVTAQARRLAVEHGYGMHESLRIVREDNKAAAEQRAEDELRAKRRAAIAATIERRVRAEAGDDIGADIAVTTIPLDLVADEVTRRVDVGLWGDLIEHDIRPTRKPRPAEAT
ncbi:hypothetical protein ACXJJ3_42085 (plasmid) [Kribbella sp. WER1]